jgi:hypothetical protein
VDTDVSGVPALFMFSMEDYAEKMDPSRQPEDEPTALGNTKEDYCPFYTEIPKNLLVLVQNVRDNFEYARLKKTGQGTYNVILRRVRELLLPWKINVLHVCVCVCVHARGACA